ncbi:hypothetical protein [Streptomyces massasporeus]|uniref:hypothetical protein n=1 Tax=Streptomyces massasporeus TaxID=67324 RepID=UPI0036AA2D6C
MTAWRVAGGANSVGWPGCGPPLWMTTRWNSPRASTDPAPRSHGEQAFGVAWLAGEEPDAGESFHGESNRSRAPHAEP